MACCAVVTEGKRVGARVRCMRSQSSPQSHHSSGTRAHGLCRFGACFISCLKALCNLQARIFRANRAMATCCIPRCVSCFDVVRYCPRCEASFAVCSAHRHQQLHCPWPNLCGNPCLTHIPVPVEQNWRAPLTYGPMYLRQFAQGVGQPPPGLTDAHQYFATAWCSEEPLLSTDGSDTRGLRSGAPCPPSAKKKQSAQV